MERPSGDLPIAPNPAMATLRIHEVSAWVLLVQLNVAQEPGTGVATLEKIVAQDPVLGKSPG
jgi:hypothetical protein